MKKFKKWAAYIVVSIILILVVAVSYVTLALPNQGEAPQLKVSITPKRVQRGKYLANHVAVCMDCHSTRKWNEFAAPIDTAILGAGGEHFDAKIGFPDDVYSPNITPAHLKNWTDGELYRAITSGVKKDGSAIFPIMPYASYGKMDREDVYSIIAYVRSLKAIDKKYPERKLDFPLNVIVHTMPKAAAPVTIPAASNKVKYGEYLITAAACADCHSKTAAYSGGDEFNMPGNMVLRSANITPDKNTGIGSWTKEQFVGRFKQYDGARGRVINPGDFQTVMPWYRYAGMKPADLEAIFAYLQTVKAVNNPVVKFQRAPADK